MLKKILYSNITRAAVYLLISVLITLGVYLAGSTLTAFYGDYSFENSYKERVQIYYELHDASKTIMDSLVNGEDPQILQSIMQGGNVEYYAAASELVYSSGQYMSPDSLPEDGCMLYIKKIGKHTEIRKPSDRYDYYFEKLPEGDYTLLVRLTDSRQKYYRDSWNAAKYAYDQLFSRLAFLAAGVLLLFVYALCICGRKSDGTLCSLRVDTVFEEIYVGLFCFCAVMVCGFTYSFIDEVGSGGGKSSPLLWIVSLCSGVLMTLVLSLLLPVVRNIKNHLFIRRSLLGRLFLWCRTNISAGYSLLKKHAADKAMFTVIGIFIIYTLLVIFLSASSRLLSYLIMAAAVIFIIKNMDGISVIIKGIYEIKEGNIDYKITGVGGMLKPVAEAVNSIGSGIADAVEKRIRSERMKSELITNVSHDLKTPLTSVINYSELLCKENLSPEKANDYAKIILEKANRLKNLTNDLFDISKVQSGNGDFHCSKIDISLLVKQTLGELNDSIQGSGLELCTSIEDNAFVMCDGEKMSRVIENLIQNALKYAMKNTRLYVNTAVKDGGVICTVKNISSYRMDFTGEEITERFARGDKSRSTEGSGLGLAIAKSYTEACGGSFSVTVDGDLFKAEIKFKAYAADSPENSLK